MPNNYDKIAKHYDFISRIVFGRSLINAQTCLLKYIEPGSNILIVGGGTGIILEEISKIYTVGLTITYVEISGNMIEIAKKRNWKQNNIHFIQQPIEDFITGEKFDIILTPFLFDNFTETKISKVFKILDSILKTNGSWLFIDFSYEEKNGKLWQKILLKIMYQFFRLTCNIEAKALVNMENIFATNSYKNIYETTHYSGFIKSIVYRK